MGLLERAHSYKDKVARGIDASAGLFTYPVLMAADILLYRTDRVPVGKDQVQHLEITRDLAAKWNQAYAPGVPEKDAPLKLPEAFVSEDTAVVPGVDGRKMSKSYGNAIDLFADDATTKKRIMGIQTDSATVESPKDPAATPIYALLALFASPDELADIKKSYEQGGTGYGKYKARLLELFHERLGPARARRKELERDLGYVDKVLADGAERARAVATPVMDAVRRASGLR
jgi:tryptophanyl-tRNA synthetase